MTCQQIRRDREEKAQKAKKDRENDRQQKYLQTDPDYSVAVENSLLNLVFGISE